jgi:hypothetical protein
MAPPKKIVYVDTNAIIEATRSGCLKAILNQYDVRTVEEVRRESLQVPKDKKSYVKVDEVLFRAQVNVSPVSAADILRAAVKAPGLMALDKGERDLLAHVADMKDPDVWVLTTADRAAVRTACALGMDARLVSLEELAAGSGQKPKLNEWFTKNWLGKVKTEYLLDGF